MTHEDQVCELNQQRRKQLLKVKPKTMSIYLKVLCHSVMQSKSPKRRRGQLLLFKLLKIVAFCELGENNILKKHTLFCPTSLDKMPVFQPYPKAEKFLSSGFQFCLAPNMSLQHMEGKSQQCLCQSLHGATFLLPWLRIQSVGNRPDPNLSFLCTLGFPVLQASHSFLFLLLLSLYFRSCVHDSAVLLPLPGDCSAAAKWKGLFWKFV